jgi:hypothetical protein
MPRSSNWSLPFRFCDQKFVFLISPMCAICPAYLNLLDLITIIVYVEYKLISSPCNFLYPVASPLHPVLHNHLRSLTLRNQVSPPYKAAGKYVLISELLSNTTFRKLDVSVLSRGGGGTPRPLGPVERANLSLDNLSKK